MKKSKIILVNPRLVGVWFLFLFLAWCWWTTFQVSFDDYIFDMKVENETYQSILNNDLSNSSSFLMKSYTEQNQTGYVSSLLITKINMKWINLDDFVNENIILSKNNYPKYTFENKKNISFDCSGINLDGKLETFNIPSIENNQILYFWQYYFITDQEWYIISFSSDRKNLRDKFSSSLGSFACK